MAWSSWITGVSDSSSKLYDLEYIGYIGERSRRLDQPDSVVGVRSQNVPPVRPVSQALHPHPLPAGRLWMLSGENYLSRTGIVNAQWKRWADLMATCRELCHECHTDTAGPGCLPVWMVGVGFNNTTTLSTFFFTYHSQPSTIRSPWGTSKRVLPTVGHLCFQPPCCHFPQPHLQNNHPWTGQKLRFLWSW